MRALAQPGVLKAAITAALISALACYPRLALWTDRVYPLWYLEALLLLGGIVLWGFVFAWHTKYTGRPVFTLKPPAFPLGLATFCGLAAALLLHFWIDPILKTRSPNEYPANGQEWVAMTLFNLVFTQLF